MKKIKFVYFDLGGVIIDYISALESLADHLSIGKEDFISYFEQYGDDLDRGILFWSDFETLLYENFKIEKRLNKSLNESFVERFIKIEETHSIIKNLEEKISVGILSNVAADTFELIKLHGSIPDIEYDSIIVSAKEKYIKPEKEIFDLALSKVKLKPEEVLFIDDTRINVEAAKSLGWNAILFETKNPQKSIKLIEEKLDLEV